MKKHTASLMTAAMLLTVAWLTGCDSKELEQPAGTGTAPALETIAEPVTEAATEAIEATEAAGQSFDDYAAFAAAMAEQHPEKTLYTPPESDSAESGRLSVPAVQRRNAGNCKPPDQHGAAVSECTGNCGFYGRSDRCHSDTGRCRLLPVPVERQRRICPVWHHR